MNESHTVTPPPGLKLGDVLYVIFRHKWKILIISGLGIITACLMPFVVPRMYQSEAKLLIKYVLEGKTARQIAGNNSQIMAVDSQGENIINTELQVLTSLDLARHVATVIGPQKVLARAGGGSDLEAAAGLIQANILADAPKGSSVVRVLFRSSDPNLVQPVLKEILASYFDMHAKVHGPGGGLDSFLDTETSDLHDRLKSTEDALRQAKAKAGVISLDDSKKAYAEQMSRIRETMLDAQAELAERETAAAEIAKLLHTKPVAATNDVALSNNVAVSAEKEAEYRGVCRLLESLRKNEDELLTHYTPEATYVKDVQAQIAANEKRKQQMEEKNPGLLNTRVWEPATAAAADSTAGPRADLISETAKVIALQSKIKLLTQQLDSIHRQATDLDGVEPTITELQRKLASDEARYRYFYDNREQAKIDAQLGAGSVSNISPIQEPSPPSRVASKLLKMMALVLVGSIGGAFALAFALEFYLDPSVKRAAEIEAKLGVPLFISIPLMHRNGHSTSLKPGRELPLLAEQNEAKSPGNGQPKPANEVPRSGEGALVVQKPIRDSAIAARDPRHVMRPFADALRDRLINFFEIKNMTHKPKLVALTSCRQGSGVSTIAAELAASLSETGDGNVLLVDMSQQEGSAHQFHRGDLACLDDALEANKRDTALVQDNLYVVAESSTGDNLPRAFPKRFKNIVPRLRASDFDYILFDLPPVSQISMTPRLSRFMDVVLMVIESEKTDKEVLKRGVALLHESQQNIGTVLNKRRSYVPKWLQQEF